MDSLADAISKDYELVREDNRGVSYARFDGHDSFYLTLGHSAKPANVLRKSPGHFS